MIYKVGNNTFILQAQNDFQEIKEELTEKDLERQGCYGCQIRNPIVVF